MSAIVCGRGRRPPTPADLEAVAAFGRFLAEQTEQCPVHPGGDCPAIPEMCGNTRCTCCVRRSLGEERRP